MTFKGRNHNSGRSSTFDATLGEGVDVRLKPMASPRHKHSDFTTFLPTHNSAVKNAVPHSFTVDEKGRQMKTEVMDHII